MELSSKNLKIRIGVEGQVMDFLGNIMRIERKTSFLRIINKMVLVEPLVLYFVDD